MTPLHLVTILNRKWTLKCDWARKAFTAKTTYEKYIRIDVDVNHGPYDEFPLAVLGTSDWDDFCTNHKRDWSCQPGTSAVCRPFCSCLFIFCHFRMTEYVNIVPEETLSVCICVCLCVCLWKLKRLNGWTDFNATRDLRSGSDLPVPFFSIFEKLIWVTSQPPFCKKWGGTVTPSILIEIEKFFFHHVVHEKVGRGIENGPLPVITSIQNGGSKLTPDAVFWRETPRVVVAQ